MELIILAGGLGTRLRDTVPGPKCMAPINGRPFLFYLINYFRSQDINRFIFSLGHYHEAITAYLQKEFSTLDYSVSLEEEPLGTGGAIQLALKKASGQQVLVTNGDSLFRADIEALFKAHLQANAECTLALKPMKDFDRYGAVTIDSNGWVKSFSEKKYYASGLINGGLYLVNKPVFLSHNFPAKFSFEQDYLEKVPGGIFSYVDDGYFIDIGIPKDYYQAGADLKRSHLELREITREWSVFIDRDGVINPEKKDDYIRNWAEFSFYEGGLEAFKTLDEKFGKIIIVSNQRGVGRQLMSETELRNIHLQMKTAIEKSGGRVDAIYYCTSTENLHPSRKPNPGMAFTAQKDLGDLDLSRSIMLGNKPSDMKFGRNAGMYTVFIATTNPEQPFPHPDIDLRFNSLAEFAKAL